MSGHGRSDKLYRTEDYTTAKMSSNVLNLMDHLNIAQAHLIGGFD
jgi:pimeloyl-ACP methyl ester carboxylesterase